MTSHSQDALETSAAEGPLWTPSGKDIAESNVTAFTKQVERDYGV